MENLRQNETRCFSNGLRKSEDLHFVRAQKTFISVALPKKNEMRTATTENSGIVKSDGQCCQLTEKYIL